MSKKVKYIISISVVILIMALGIITLIMALVPVGSNDAINLPNHVYIYTNLIDKENGKIELHRRDGTGEDANKINKIFDLFNDGFRQQKALSALFSGNLGKGLEFVDHEPIDGMQIMDKYKDDEENITIVFCYNEAQKVNNAPEDYDGYGYVCFTVTSSKGLQDMVLGLLELNSSNESGDVSTSNTISYRYSLEGKMYTAELYNYVNSLLEVHKDN